MIAAVIIVIAGGALALAFVGKSLYPTLATADSGNGEDTTPDDTVSYSGPAGQDGDGGNVGATVGWSITSDPATWPSGTRIWDICRAIALAEGYNVATAAPFKLNNPGDISDGANIFGSEPHSGSSITHFPDPETGWNWLYQKIENHINGKSSTYPKTLTVTQFAQKYAANWQPWTRIVGSQLDISPESTTFAEYAGVGGGAGGSF